MTTEAILKLTDNMEALAEEVAKIQKQEQKIVWRIAPYIALAISVMGMIFAMGQQAAKIDSILQEHTKILVKHTEILDGVAEKIHTYDVRHGIEDALAAQKKK